MKKAIFTILVFMVFLGNLKGQEKKDLAVSVSTGLFNSPYYDNANARGFYRIDFDYHLSSKQILNVNYLAGQHYYYDDVLSNDPTSRLYEDGTNSTAEYRTFSIMYKYKILNNSYISIVPGIGAGIMTHTRDFPYREENTWYTATSSWSDLVFPVNLDLNLKVFNHWQIGLTGGFLIHPDYPILALHGGPKLSFIIP